MACNIHTQNLFDVHKYNATFKCQNMRHSRHVKLIRENLCQGDIIVKLPRFFKIETNFVSKMNSLMYTNVTKLLNVKYKTFIPNLRWAIKQLLDYLGACLGF